MTPLQRELRRLYGTLSVPSADDDAQAVPPVDPDSGVCCMVLELTAPPGWEPLSAVWRGVQADLDLPAPGIAVSGTDGLQLWFSLAEPIPVAQAHVFLAALQARFLPDVKPGRIHRFPAADALAQQPHRQAPRVPALQESTGNWSAFVAQDLAPVFEDTPWLDVPPNEEGQAALLRALKPMPPAAFQAAVQQLAARTQTPAPRPPGMPAAGAASPVHEDEPRRFLLKVMHDESVALALRIDAAKALLR